MLRRLLANCLSYQWLVLHLWDFLDSCILFFSHLLNFFILFKLASVCSLDGLEVSRICTQEIHTCNISLKRLSAFQKQSTHVFLMHAYVMSRNTLVGRKYEFDPQAWHFMIHSIILPSCHALYYLCQYNKMNYSCEKLQ